MTGLDYIVLYDHILGNFPSMMLLPSNCIGFVSSDSCWKNKLYLLKWETAQISMKMLITKTLNSGHK